MTFRRLVSVAAIAVSLACAAPAFAATIMGSDGDNNLYGTSSADTMNGNGGDDWVAGKGSADEVAGGLGPDAVLGDGGADTVRGNGGNDWVIGGSWDYAAQPTWSDTTQGDVLFGGGGDDYVLSGPGDHVDCGDGYDLLLLGIDRSTPSGLAQPASKTGCEKTMSLNAWIDSILAYGDPGRRIGP